MHKEKAPTEMEDRVLPEKLKRERDFIGSAVRDAWTASAGSQYVHYLQIGR